jgi:hypothetical protein
MHIANQGVCQSRKTAENMRWRGLPAHFPNQELAGFATIHLGTFATRGASKREEQYRGVSNMLGKLAGAWLGSRIAGNQRGAKGAIIGYGATALARRSVPALAAVALGGWAFRKLRDRRSSRGAAYPSEATPSSF